MKSPTTTRPPKPPSGALPLPLVNELSRDEFVTLLGEVFEHAPWVAEAAFEAGPFESPDTLHEALVAAMRAASDDQRTALIDGHPELAGKAAAEGGLTAASAEEQAAAGLNACSAEELADIASLNAEYSERFAMPFIMAVKGRTRAQIFSAFRGRLKRSPAVEREEALMQIERIARFRVDALVSR